MTAMKKKKTNLFVSENSSPSHSIQNCPTLLIAIVLAIKQIALQLCNTNRKEKKTKWRIQRENF